MRCGATRRGASAIRDGSVSFLRLHFCSWRRTYGCCLHQERTVSVQRNACRYTRRTSSWSGFSRSAGRVCPHPACPRARSARGIRRPPTPQTLLFGVPWTTSMKQVSSTITPPSFAASLVRPHASINMADACGLLLGFYACIPVFSPPVLWNRRYKHSSQQP